MAETGLVSVIVPTYNYGHLIHETLDSLLAQSYVQWECIVVDNGSTDHTSEIVSKYSATDPRFKLLRESHTTTSSARNRGLRESRGEFIQFLDADDQLEFKKLEQHVRILQNNESVSLVYSNARYYDHGNNQVLRPTLHPEEENWMLEFTGNSLDFLEPMLTKNRFVISSPVFRSSILSQSGLFNDALNWVEDWEFYVRLLCQNLRVVFDAGPDTFSRIRVHPKSLSRNQVMMVSHSLKARECVEHTLQKLVGASDELKQKLIGSNRKVHVYLIKYLFNLSADKSKAHKLRLLLAYYIRTKDLKTFIKFFGSTLVGISVEFTLD